MNTLTLKIRIALLWVFIAIASVADPVYKLMQQNLTGEPFNEAFSGTLATNTMVLYVLVPLVMVILTVSLKDKGSRWTNVVMGIFWALSTIAYVVTLITTKYVPVIVINIAVVVASVLILVYALRWPKYK